MSRVRVRRPLLALIVLVVVLIVGYSVRALDSSHSSQGPSPGTSAPSARSATASPSSGGVSSPPSTGGPSSHPSSGPRQAGLPLSTLPVAVAQTVHLIQAGGPFPYPRNDGVVFHNDEHLLPHEPDGYYHEYTVPTPGAPDRGGQRIVTGKNGEYYYTSDHYESFIRVDVGP